MRSLQVITGIATLLAAAAWAIAASPPSTFESSHAPKSQSDCLKQMNAAFKLMDQGAVDATKGDFTKNKKLVEEGKKKIADGGKQLADAIKDDAQCKQLIEAALNKRGGKASQAKK